MRYQLLACCPAKINIFAFIRPIVEQVHQCVNRLGLGVRSLLPTANHGSVATVLDASKVNSVYSVNVPVDTGLDVAGFLEQLLKCSAVGVHKTSGYL